MKNKIRVIGAGVTSLVGLLLVSGTGWAQPNQTPVSGEVVSARLTSHGERWEDADGYHERNNRGVSEWRGDIDGRMFRVNNVNEDLVTGEVQVYGVFSFVGVVLGELVTATGTFKGKCTLIEGGGRFCERRRVWHLSDGGVIKTSGSRVLGTHPYDYVGIIHDNPGNN